MELGFSVARYARMLSAASEIRIASVSRSASACNVYWKFLKEKKQDRVFVKQQCDQADDDRKYRWLEMTEKRFLGAAHTDFKLKGVHGVKENLAHVWLALLVLADRDQTGRVGTDGSDPRGDRGASESGRSESGSQSVRSGLTQ